MVLFRGDEKSISQKEVLGGEMDETVGMYIFLLMKILIRSVNIDIKKYLQLKTVKKGCQISVMDEMEKT